MFSKTRFSAMLAEMGASSIRIPYGVQLSQLIHHRVQRMCGSRVQRVLSRTICTSHTDYDQLFCTDLI